MRSCGVRTCPLYKGTSEAEGLKIMDKFTDFPNSQITKSSNNQKQRAQRAKLRNLETIRNAPIFKFSNLQIFK